MNSTSLHSESTYEILYKIKSEAIFSNKKVPNRLKCIICNDLVKNAKQTTCGCKGCYSCMKIYLKDGPKPCPNKNDCEGVTLNIDNILPDNATNKEILSMAVKCPHKNCQVTSQIKDLSEHIYICEYREIMCDKCEEMCQIKLMDNHTSTQCKKRLVECEYCFQNYPLDQFENNHHNINSDELCSQYKEICPNNCEVTGQILLRNHLKVCSNQKSFCPYHKLDCNMNKMTKKELVNHLNRQGNQHTIYLIDQINTMKDELKEFRENNEHFQKLFEEIKESNKKGQEVFKKLSEEMKKVNHKMEAENIQKIDEIFRSGTYIMKIDDFESKKQKAEGNPLYYIASDPFYTSEFGYKMCLKIYPAGHGVGRGTHISVYFAVMNGDYDNIQSWPFKHKVTLTLLDLDISGVKLEKVIEPFECPESFGTPTNGLNKMVGEAKFISFHRLMNEHGRYCRNDTLFLQIHIDETEESEVD